MKKIQKRLLSWLMIMAMVLSVIHISAPMVVQAEENDKGITFNDPKFNEGRTQYTFPNVTVNMESGVDKQKIFSISVSDGGSFVADFDKIGGNKVDISGVSTENKYVDNSGNTGIPQISNNTKLISITILGGLKDDEIKEFIQNMTFYRNTDEAKKEQKVSVVSSTYDVREDGGAALAFDGELHIYKYIDWDEDEIQVYKGMNRTVDRSSVWKEPENWNWFTAYKLAKQETANGLKGYLATITNDYEQSFIYNRFGAIRVKVDDENHKDRNDHEDGAWIGGARTYIKGEITTAGIEEVVLDADTMNKLFPANGTDGLTGERAKAWRWMCGPESHDDATVVFFETNIVSSNHKPESSEIVKEKYTKWSNTEPNNYSNGNKYKQEFCLQYGYNIDGGWNDWGPEHSPRGGDEDVKAKTESGEDKANSKAPAGFLVEFSAYDIDGDGNKDKGEEPEKPVEKDFTVVTAEPHIISATIDKNEFKYNEPITVQTVIGDYTNDDHLENTEVPEYLWQVYDETTGKWVDAANEATKKQRTYTPVAADVGKKLRVKITATSDVDKNTKGYVGTVYADADNSDDLSDKVEGTPVLFDDAKISGNDFMIAKDVVNTIDSSILISDYTNAKATIEGDVEGKVSEIDSVEINNLRSTAVGDSADITLVNEKYPGVAKTVKGTVFDNAEPPVIDNNNKMSQIGSNDFSVLQGSGPLSINDVVDFGNVKVLTDGIYTDGKYSVTEEQMNVLNDAVKNGPDGKVVQVEVTDNTTGLKTTIDVTIKGIKSPELEKGKLSPYKGKDENDKWTHYNAGEPITVEAIYLKGVDAPLTGDKLTDGSFNYEWQFWSGDGDKVWQPIPNANGTEKITLSAEDTLKYAKNKIQVVVTPVDDNKYGITSGQRLCIDGDGSSTSLSETTGGTYIDIFTIDADDFVVSLKEAQEITDELAASYAGVETQKSNNNNKLTTDVETAPTSDVDTKLNTLTSIPESPVPVTFEATTEGDLETPLKAVDKEEYENSKKIAYGKTVNAYIKDSAKTVSIDDDTLIGIGANNIVVSKKTVEASLLYADSDAEVAKKIGDLAKVVVVDDGKKIDSVSYAGSTPELQKVKISYKSGEELKADVGRYPITYTYTNADGDTVSTDAYITVLDDEFKVVPENPNPKDPENPSDGITGPNDDPSNPNTTTDIYKTITIPYNQDSVKLIPEITEGSTIEKLTVEESVINPIPKDGVYTLSDINKGEKKEVVYEVKTPGGDKIKYHYTVDRLKGPDVSGEDFMISKEDLDDIDSPEVLKLSEASATTDGDTPTEVKQITDDELNQLKSTEPGGTADITLTNNAYPEETKPIKAYVFDNVNVPDKTTPEGKDKPSIGSNDYTINVSYDGGNFGPVQDAAKLLENSKLTVLDKEGKKITVNAEMITVNLDEVNDLIKANNNGEKTVEVTVKLTDSTELKVPVTITVNAIPEIAKGQLNTAKFAENDEIKVITVLDSNNKEVPLDKVEYQWEKYNEDTHQYEPIPGATSKTYTPDGTTVKEGDFLRVAVTGNNTDYVGTVYIKAGSSVPQNNANINEKDTGSEIEKDKDPSLSAHDFLISREDAADPKDDDIIDYGEANATDADGDKITPDVDDESKDNLKKEAKKENPDPVTVTYVNPEKPSLIVPVTATILDNVTTDDDGSQIGSNNYSVYGESGAQTTQDVVSNGNVVIMKEGEKLTGNYSIPEDDLKKLNDAIAANEDTVVPVNVTDSNTGLTTPVKVTVIPVTKAPEIKTTAEPDPERPDEVPKVDDSKDPETVGDKLVKKITITVPSKQSKLTVDLTPVVGLLDLKYGSDSKGLDIVQKPAEATVDNNLSGDPKSFTVDKLSTEKDTIVKARAVSKDGKSEIIYEYTIVRLRDNNINVDTSTTDPTPDDPSDDPKVDDPVGPKPEKIDGNDEQVKDIKITVPHKTTFLEVVPTPEDPSAVFVTDFGKSGINVGDGTTIDEQNSSVTPKAAKFTVTDLETDHDSEVSVKVKSADGSSTCVYRYTIVREKNDDATIKDVTPSPESTDDEKIVEITTDKTEYTWPVELNDPNATVDTIDKVSGDGTLTSPEDKSNFKVEGLKPGETTVIKVKTVAENGKDTLTYLVKITNNQPKDAITPTQNPTPTGTDGTSEPVKPEDITYEKTNPQDKTEPIDPSKQVPTTGALTINGVPVDSYTISPDGKSLIISKDYLNTLPKGSYPAVLTYADGTKQEFNVNVVDFDETTLVKNPPLFSMYKEIVLKKKNTFTVNLKGISDYAIVTSEITGKGKKAKKVVTIKQQKNGDVLITPKKVGKSQVTCKIVQNGAEYKVVVDLKVLKQYKGTSKNYNLKPKGLVKTSGELPEFNVYKRIVKGKNTKIKFTKVATDAKVKFYVANKKEAKSLKIGKIKRKGKTATCTIKGKKKGWVHLTAEITQNGKTYYTRLLVRIDDGTWSKKQLKKYLK